MALVQEYTPTEIIKQDLARSGFTKDEDKFLKGLVVLLNEKKAFIIRHNNTVFVFVRKEPGVLEVHMYTIDPMSTLPQAMKVAFDTIKKSDVKKLKSETTNPRLIKMIETLGPVKTTKKGKNIAWELEVNK